MTVVRDVHEAHEATFTSVGGHAIPAEYGRPDRAHAAVRRVVGVTEHPYGILTIDGPDWEELLTVVLSDPPPTTEGMGDYYLYLENDRIVADCYVYHAGDRGLCFAAAGTAELLADHWRGELGEFDVSIELQTDAFGVFGVHGPKATEKVASVLTGPGAPDDQHGFVRGTVGDHGVTIIRTEDLTGEEGYEVVVQAEVADRVFDSLINHGLNATPFGRQTWESLTLEAGSPLFESELLGRHPTELGLGHLYGDSTGQASGRLVGLSPAEVPDVGTPVTAAGRPIGSVTRACYAPTLETPAALAVVETSTPSTVTVASEELELKSLPFYDGSARSGRLPR